jgi:hypothetical protein
MKIYLSQAMFEGKERTLLEQGVFSASTFRFDTGVAALRIKNDAGELVLLPFQGQQIWSATFGGRDLTMKSMFSQPYPGRPYLETYGGFMLHCGMTAMGVPAAGDTHPLHGELPNAVYPYAWIVLGEDEHGQYIGMSGRYQHTVAFAHNYVAEPLVRLYTSSSIFYIGIEVQNLKKTPMEIMYMAHVNFRPVDHGRFVQTAHTTAQTMRVRTAIPSHVKPTQAYLDFLTALQGDPTQANVLKPGMAFAPEQVFYIDYLADANGWAHSMQVHADGSADYIAHRPEQLCKGVRWISRTPDQDCLGIVLPATAEPEGYSAEKAKGNLQLLPGGESWRCDLWAGYLSKAQAQEREGRIQSTLA